MGSLHIYNQKQFVRYGTADRFTKTLHLISCFPFVECIEIHYTNPLETISGSFKASINPFDLTGPMIRKQA